MRAVLLGLCLVVGCVDEDDEFEGVLSDFDGPVLGFRPTAHGVGLFVELPAKGRHAPCPVLGDISASIEGVPFDVSVTARGRYDGFWEECDAAGLAIDAIAQTADVSVRLETAGVIRVCPFQNRHLDPGLERVDGGTWQARSADTLRVRFAGPELDRGRLVAHVAIPGGLRDEVSVGLVEEADGVMAVQLGSLEPADYALVIEEATMVGPEPTGRCAISTGLFASAPLTIVAP